jgi:hypothetical protein
MNGRRGTNMKDDLEDYGMTMVWVSLLDSW